MARRIAVIFNPTAGRRRHRRLQAILGELRRHGCEVAVLETSRPGEATALARQAAASGAEVIVAAGGDGTVNEVINGIVGSGAALAVIPLGTANVLAHEIAMPLQAGPIAAVIARGPARPIHLGRVDERYFVMMASAGFDNRVIAAVPPGLKRWLGKFAYVMVTIWALIRHPGPACAARVDGKKASASLMIAANGSRYAGGFVIAPAARLTEPVLQICLFPGRRRRDLARYAVALLCGRLHRVRDLQVLSAQGVTFEERVEESVQVDGEIIARLPQWITIAEDTLPLIMPQEPG